jgi:hypothetical protein
MLDSISSMAKLCFKGSRTKLTKKVKKLKGFMNKVGLELSTEKVEA